MLSDTLRIAGIANDSIVDGPGIRFTIFVQGCPHRCKGCHNPQTHDFNGGEVVTLESLLEKIKSNPLLDGVTFSGGEPFYQAKPLYELALEVKKLGMSIVVYSGYTIEDLFKMSEEEPNNFYIDLLSTVDYLIDGPFKLDKRNILLKFRGSSNQRIINVQKSINEERIVEEDWK